MKSENGYKPTLFPTPNIEPLERLAVKDGLLLTADYWRRAHTYHRDRQNIHYQSLQQPGIVCGLGVSVIPAPADLPAQYRDGRWLQIQSGIAIDLVGNPIIVPQPIDFRITSEAYERPLIVYVVLSYVDPDKLQRQTSRDIVQETFRIDERTSPPSNLEVELCRILLQPGLVQLEKSDDVFAPGVNSLDLRYRLRPKARPKGVMRVAQLTQNNLQENSKIVSNLSYLLQSVAALYPALQVSEEVGEVTFKTELEGVKLSDYDLIYLTYQQLFSLQESEIETVRQYWQAGGVLLVEASSKEINIKELNLVHQQLQEAIADLEGEDELAEIKTQLEAELKSVEADLAQTIDKVAFNVKKLAQQLGTFPDSTGHLSHTHPLRTQPFLFGQFPTINKQPTQPFNWGGIILVIGELSTAWGLDERLLLPREIIRNAQEMGINILYFAWRKHQLTQLQELQELQE